MRPTQTAQLPFWQGGAVAHEARPIAQRGEDPAGIFRARLGNEDPVDGRQIDPRRREEPQPTEGIEEEMGVVGGAEVGEQAEGRSRKSTVAEAFQGLDSFE